MNKKDMPNSSNQQRKLELEAAERVVPWSGLAPDDYNFRSWATAPNKSLVRAGCVYEYARESRKLRCLLVLINFAFQGAEQTEKQQGQSQPFRFLLWSFEGLRYKDALLQLGGWFGWLRLLTDQLAENTSFADLLEKNDNQVNEWLDELPKYFFAPRAVEIMLPDRSITRFEPRLLSSSQPPNAYHRNSENDVYVPIQIRFGDFTNREIGLAMEELASELRPFTAKEPTRKGGGKKDTLRSWLDALSATRLASYHPKTSPSEMVRRRKKTSARGTETALSLFEDVRLGSIQPGSTRRKIRGALSQNELDRYAARARRQFQDMFPFGEPAANSVTWAERQRRQIV